MINVNFFFCFRFSIIFLKYQYLTGLYKHCKGPRLCTKEHKEAQRTIRGILISTKDLHIKFQVKK